ncbi:hypothetical protein VNO77_24306 [Canavalia gladiata]|uniref:Uncharacterized protein n=1 Tax=Canavalia gladiata TaxID=3824 RepID=A0AAN9L616_CANGL
MDLVKGNEMKCFCTLLSLVEIDVPHPHVTVAFWFSLVVVESTLPINGEPLHTILSCELKFRTTKLPSFLL